MADQRHADEHAHDSNDTAALSIDRRQLRRRGLIAGAAALVAGVLATRGSQPTAAQGEALVVGNSANSPGYQAATAMTDILAAVSGNPAFRIVNNDTNLLRAAADGIQGYTNGNGLAGVYGENDTPNGYGVFGVAWNSATGVYGLSGNGNGVFGAGQYGVYGTTTAPGGTAVAGQTTAASAAAVAGSTSNASSYAAYFTGTSVVVGNLTVGGPAANHALFASSSAANYAALYGSGSGSAYAGYFSGKVTVAGDFAVTGSKSALVPFGDGTHRLVYCVEATEAWFEDFGTGTLAAGKAAITIDPEFAALIDTKQYHVFLSEYDDHNNLFVAKREATGFTVQATGFTVQAKGAPQATGAFSYRIVGTRKDKPGVRLAKVTGPVVLAPPEAPKPRFLKDDQA
ncbi:MAG: hypothetical protein ACR2JW_16940 [Thermomicrobiales bacterium]